MPAWLLYTIGVLVFAFGLLASIALHEIGHMVPAKRFGVKVTQYMVGFGPTLWSRKRGDTEYGIKALPLGGYIRMIGMVPPPRADGRRSRWPRRLATAVEDFRSMSRSEVEPGDGPREFYRLTPGKKMIIMLGGPVMNLIIFVVLFVILVMAIGVSQTRTTSTVGSITKCVVAADSQAATGNKCPAGAPLTPAFQSLKLGDRIVSVNGTKVAGWSGVSDVIRRSAGTTIRFGIVRDGQRITVPVTPVRNTFSPNASSAKTITAGFVGLSPRTEAYFAPQSLTQVPGQIGAQINLGVDAIASYPGKLHSLYQTVFEGKARDPQGAVGVVGIGRISGDYARTDLLDRQEKIYALLYTLASINLLLFFFNLLPLLPLDGGHVAGAIVESIKRGWARLRARQRPRELVGVGQSSSGGHDPDGAPLPAAAPERKPIFVDTAQMLPIMYAVASVLVVLTLLTLYADIVKPINPLGG